MWQQTWRESVWAGLDTAWDVIIIGGGITGAGILREAANAGLRALLVEQHDFGSGTSSRSSKLVHGGLRYLKNAQVTLTLESVRERELLLRQGRGLVSPLGFLMANFKGDPLPGWVFGAGLIFYDLLAMKWGHRHYDAYDLRELCPSLTDAGLQGGYRFFDAQTDDARLVLRVIQEACAGGGVALNYARVTGLLRRSSGDVCGVLLEDQVPGSTQPVAEVRATLVINASGAWADELRSQVGGRGRLRRLRGSHLVFPHARLPLTRAVNLLHPQDGRPVFAFPWEGVTLLGTTDVDHGPHLQTDPAISPEEAEYLLAAVQRAFPCLELTLADVQATFSGIRPVIDTGKANPSKESREHVLWCENGLLTVAGGKLTTFRRMARAALKAACRRVPAWSDRVARLRQHDQVLKSPPSEFSLSEDLNRAAQLRLFGRFGAQAPAAVAAAGPGELALIPGTLVRWFELRWAARGEAAVHLDDLLLRRVRLGLLLPHGGLEIIARIRSIVQPELGWDDRRWEQELAHYTELWNRCYHLGHI